MTTQHTQHARTNNPSRATPTPKGDPAPDKVQPCTRPHSYRRDDLLTVAKVLTLAHCWIHRQQAEALRRPATAA